MKYRKKKVLLGISAILLILFVLGIGLLFHEISYHDLKVHVYRNPITELQLDDIQQISHCIDDLQDNRHIYTEQEMTEFVRIYNDLNLPQWGGFIERDHRSDVKYDGIATSTAKISIEMKDGTKYFLRVWYNQKAAGVEEYQQQYWFLLERGAQSTALHPVLEERYRCRDAEALIEFHNQLGFSVWGTID